MKNYIAFYQDDIGQENIRFLEADTLTDACELAEIHEHESWHLCDLREREGWLEYNLFKVTNEKGDLEGALDLAKKEIWRFAKEAYRRGYGVSETELRRIAEAAGEEA